MTDALNDKHQSSPVNNANVWALIAAIVILSILTLAGVFLDRNLGQGSLSWIILTFGGFGILVALLFAGAMLFRNADLQDPEQSLALPRHSVRSLLTFFIFMFLMVFILNSIQHMSGDEGVLKVPEEQAQKFIEDMKIAERIISLTTEPRDLKTQKGDTAETTIRFRVKTDKDVLDYFERILIALFGISSSIIGFYFGSRSRESTPELKNFDKPDPPIDGNTIEDVDAPDIRKTDGGGVAIGTTILELREINPGEFVGNVNIITDDKDAGKRIAASFEPSTKHDQPTDKANIKVSRDGDVLTLTISNIKPKHLSEESKIAIYFADEEERAQTVPVTLTGRGN